MRDPRRDGFLKYSDKGSLFRLTEEEIPKYNELTDKLNEHNDWLLEFQKQIRMEKNCSDNALRKYLAIDGTYQERLKTFNELLEQREQMENKGFDRLYAQEDKSDVNRNLK